MILAFTTDMPFPNAEEPAANALERKLERGPLDCQGREPPRFSFQAIIDSKQGLKAPLAGLLNMRRLVRTFTESRCSQIREARIVNNFLNNPIYQNIFQAIFLPCLVQQLVSLRLLAATD